MVDKKEKRKEKRKEKPKIVVNGKEQSVYYGTWWKKHGKKHLAEEREARRQRRIKKDIPLLRKWREKIWEKADSNIRGGVLPSRVVLPVDVGDKKKDVVLYAINVLASLVSRNPQTIRMWERQKFIPITPYRDQYGRRLYSRPMILAICEIYDLEGGWVHRETVYDHVKKVWVELGVMK